VLRAALQQDVAAVRVTGRTGAAENFGPATGSGRRATRAANNLSLAARTGSAAALALLLALVMFGGPR
jgi:hypothetical protein